MRFEGRSAIVTGASEGIGFAIARQLAAAGAGVVLTARREPELAAAAQRIGPRASYVACDMADPGSAQRAVDHAVRVNGGLDLLVCNAGILIPGAVATQSMVQVQQVVTVNLLGTIAMVGAAAPVLARHGEAAIVVISSSIGRRPAAGLGVYGATKAALHYLVPTWAIELAPAGVRVNAICAGITDTPGLRAAAAHAPGLEKAVIRTNLVKRIAAAEEIAEPALILLDNVVSGFTTGSVWDVDGGYQRDTEAGGDDDRP